MTGDAFRGIPAQVEGFLRALAANNSVDWFAAHRAEYEALALEPLRRLREALLPAMRAIDPAFEPGPAAGLSRIRRDTRFSRDKSPFRTTQWIAFKRHGKDWTSRPAFFMEFGLETRRHGMGFYSAGAPVMAELRALAQERPKQYAAALARARRAGYALTGEEYRRPRPPLDQPACVQELHRLRNVHLEQSLGPAEALDNPRLADTLAVGFSAAAPLYRLWLLAAERAAQRIQEDPEG